MLDQEVLRQTQLQLHEKLLALRSEELTWLKLFLLLYSGLAAWLIARWLSAESTTRSLSNLDLPLLYGTLAFSWLGLLVASEHFLRLRRSYFRVGRMLVRCQEQLGLFEPGREIFPWRLGEVTDLASWRGTRIEATFTTRVGYIAGGNLAVTLLATAALVRRPDVWDGVAVGSLGDVAPLRRSRASAASTRLRVFESETADERAKLNGRGASTPSGP